MASQSIETSLAPTDFPIFSSFEDSNGIISVAVERCQLCDGTKRHFYCRECITKGEIVHSKAPQSERYKDKIQRWTSMKKTRSKLLYKCEDKVAERSSLEEKKKQVREHQRRIRLLREAVKQAEDKLNEEKASIESSKQEAAQKCLRAARHTEKKTRILKRMNKVQDYMKQQIEKSLRVHRQLSDVRSQLVRQLVDYIFSIEEVEPKVETDVMQMSTVSALAEARHTAYIRGRWVYTDHGGELQYRVVHPSLPGNGDYSPYNIWLLENKAAVSGRDSDYCQRNPAYTISAALCYTTQLVMLLAHLLGVNLPKRLCYSEFSQGEMSEKDFNKAVYKLNHNVLYLCFTQMVAPELLQPRHTIHNLLMLLRTSQLGRSGDFLVNSDLMHSFEESHQQEHHDLDLESSADEDEVEHGEVEWEQVPVTLPEADLPTAPADSYFTSTQSESTLPSGLMATVASFWRTATGTKPPDSPAK